MNAQGIRVFYGATHPEVALAEVRPPVGSRVVVAQFDVRIPLRLLDVEALQMLSVGVSPFDPHYLIRKQKASFLSGLSERITMPVMPDDEALSYIATQVIAEYLASLQHPHLDGMIYPSAQAGEGMKNVVLFHKAAAVATVERPDNVEFNVTAYEDYETGPEIDYRVCEEFDSEAVTPQPREPTLRELMTEVDAVIDEREPALALSTENVRVHHIKHVEIRSERFPVSRSEFDKKTMRDFEEGQKRLQESLRLRNDHIEL